MGLENWSADPKYTVPFTTAGVDETICSFWVSNCVTGRQNDLPHPLALKTSTIPLFSPMYTSPLATVGAEIMAACAPTAAPVHKGAQTELPQPEALKADRMPSPE